MNDIKIESVFTCPHCQGILNIVGILGTQEFKSLWGKWQNSRVQNRGKGSGRPRKGESRADYLLRVGKSSKGKENA